MNAGSRVIDAAKPTPMVTDNAGPIVEKMPNDVKINPKKVMATVPAEPAITLPMVPSASTRASSDSMPIFTHSW